MRRTREDAMETRRTILRVALDCFSTRGYALTTFTDIAKRIQLTKSAVHWHFKTKEDLLAELIAQEHQIYQPLKGLEAAQTLDDVKCVFLQWAEAIATHPELRQFLHFTLSRVEWSEALTGTLSKRLEGLMLSDPFERLVACLARLRANGNFSSPLCDRQIASLLLTLFFGTHREAWLRQHDWDVASTIAAGLDFILQGLRRH